MMAMQKIAPKIKALQAKYKNDQQKLQQETMALYKSEGVNPLAGCLPLLLQYPFIISVFYMVLQHKELYANQHFLWIGSADIAARTGFRPSAAVRAESRAAPTRFCSCSTASRCTSACATARCPRPIPRKRRRRR